MVTNGKTYKVNFIISNIKMGLNKLTKILMGLSFMFSPAYASDNLTPSSNEFFQDFTSQNLTIENPLSIEDLVDTYLPENLFWISMNTSIKDGKTVHKKSNTSTAFHIGNGYFLTAEHCVDHLPDSIWTTKEPIDFGGKTSLSFEEVGRNHTLEHALTKENYTFRIISRNEDLDVAILEIEDSFKENVSSEHPLIYLDGRGLSQGDTVVHFINGLHGYNWSFFDNVKDKEGIIKVKNSENEDITWITYEPKQSNNDLGNPWYLNVEGFIFPYTKEGLEERKFHSKHLSNNVYNDISTVMAYSGNSGAPLFRKIGDKYTFIGVITEGRLNSNIYKLLGLNFQQKSTPFAKPPLFKEFIDSSTEEK